MGASGRSAASPSRRSAPVTPVKRILVLPALEDIRLDRVRRNGRFYASDEFNDRMRDGFATLDAAYSLEG